jgi:hypothetical protein
VLSLKSENLKETITRIENKECEKQRDEEKNKESLIAKKNKESVNKENATKRKEMRQST